MASEIKVNNIKEATGTTITLGDGAGKTITVDAATVNLGRCGGTVALACGATSTGFGITGITWCTTAKTGAFCAAAGSGYLVNTTSTAFTATLPGSPTIGDQIAFVDFAGTFDSNALTVGANSKKIKGSTCDATVDAARGAVTIIYTGTTQGWITTSQANAASFLQETFIVATGGNTTITCGNYKTHIFTATGPLCVSVAGSGGAALEQIDYLVVAGGGGAGDGTSNGGGGAGAGGYREGRSCPGNYTGSPLVAATGITSAVTDYTITVGGGGPGGTGNGCQGSSSVFSTITSAGGGYGGYANNAGGPGGSGGGGSYQGNGGCGNDPAVSPAQGFDGGGTGACPSSAGNGGGGALVVGGAATPTPAGGAGGNGANIGCNFFGPTSPSYGTPGSNPGRYFSGGGGSSGYGAPAPASPGGEGGGGAGGIPSGNGVNGTVNTGGGGGGGRGGTSAPHTGGDGGSGFVAIRYKFQ